MAIKVINETQDNIRVSINHWGKGGETDFYNISPCENKSWGRSDPRGFIMVVSMNGSSKPYYVLADSHIHIKNNYVTDSDRIINPIERFRKNDAIPSSESNEILV